MTLTYKEAITLTEVAPLRLERALEPVLLTDATMEARKAKVLRLMREEGLDAMVIYGDLEHGGNFEYLTGFVTRFEEGVLVLHQNGTAYLLLGNENLNKAEKARLKAKPIHVPHFSLPNQPMNNDQPFEAYLQEAGLTAGMKTGLIGWKLFTTKYADNRTMFDVPYYIVTALNEVVGNGNLTNRADLMIGTEKGARVLNNANEIAHYEFGAQLASKGILEALDLMDIGVSEMALGNVLNLDGQPNTVVTIAAAGERFIKANIYPTARKVQLQDPISLTVGYKGGLSSRAGYAVHTEEELPSEKRDYLDVLAKPYYAAVVTWLENAHIGMTGDSLYQMIEEVMPQSKYHWHLNPGHLTSDEEWMSSPIYAGSMQTLKSGMALQVDIIPSHPGYAGVSCESGIVFADAMLKNQIKTEYPELYTIFEKRRAYVKDSLNILIHEDILPMNDTLAFLRPFLLNKTTAFKKNSH